MTLDIALVLSVLGLTVFLFISELLRVDVIAILIMISLAWLRLVKPAEAFSGLSSNAVISIIAVMILGYGVDRSGVMNRITRPIMRVAGSSEKRLIAVVSAVVGVISAFMQNIGAAALFLPALVRISRKTKIPTSRLLMPMGFAAILGGTVSMVGSGPLIILNDLLKQGGHKAFGLFSVTPMGLSLLVAGIIYFIIFGRIVLPGKTKEDEDESPQQQLIETWQLPSTIYECVIPPESPLIGKTREDILLSTNYRVNVLAVAEDGDILHAPWRYTRFAARQQLALLGERCEVERLVVDHKLQLKKEPEAFESLRSSSSAGFAEIIIPPRSSVAGKTLRKIAMRKSYGVEPIMLLTGSGEERGDFSDRMIEAGDAMIVHGLWENIRAMADNQTYVLITPIEAETRGKSKPITAIICFLGAIALALSGFQLSVGLLTGALAMIILRVITIDEAYKAVDWRTVFLLAGLIPLGIAMDKTGAASYVADQMMRLLQGNHPVFILAAFALLSTIFSLFMSNVAATVLLVPLVIIMGSITGIKSRDLALLVGVCASNSFVLPTHQVNALLMSPGGYRNANYLKAGGIMTLLFIVIAVTIVYFFYL
jgi:di/tricarboxylate transporter